MKKLTGIVAGSFMAGMLCFGIGDRVADEVWAPKSAEAHWKNLGIEDQSLLFQKYTLAADGDEAMCEKILSKEECGAGSSCMWSGESNKCEQYEGSYDDMLNKYYGINRDDKG